MTTPSEYFEITTPPNCLIPAMTKVKEFISVNRARGKRMVLVTSGGTTVPLESQTVRFLDNFSAGTRGATSAEYFLEHGYACIFLHRQWSLEPYTRHYTHSKNCFLDLLVQINDEICVKKDHFEEISSVLHKYQTANVEQLLLKIDFTTVAEYLFLLKSITIEMSIMKENAMFYLAAAVSDFFIPEPKMVEHKIQSSGGGLSISMDSVPKIIKPLVKEWAPTAFTVSFKLETDTDLLISKSKAALNNYGHQLVIANLLTTRKHVVWLINLTSERELRLTPTEIKENAEIEKYIVQDLIRLHEDWINKMN
jgi:phosphopantothenate---cysteine ligase (ATP)